MGVKTLLQSTKISVLGAGNMGSALVKGLVEKSVYPQKISVFDIDMKKLNTLRKETNVRLSKSARQCASLADVVILAVKPGMMPAVCQEIASSLQKDAMVISIAAGVSIAQIEGYLKKSTAIVRVMPNMPALVGAGMSAFSVGKHVSVRHKKMAEEILQSFGLVVLVPEKQLDLVTAISGSGPAYFFLLAQNMIEVAYEMGMKVDVAKKLVYQTAFGSGKVLSQSLLDPEELIEKVASKGGTTEAALKCYKRFGFGRSVHEAVKAAHKRSLELKKG